MNIRSIALAAFAAFALASPSFATNLCYERQEAVGSYQVDILGPVKYVASMTGGKDGWDGQGGKCTKANSSRVWVGPRDSAGRCLTPASIVGTTPGPVYATKIAKVGEETVIEYEDQRRYGVFVTIRGQTRWIGTNWKPGTC